MEGNTIEQGGGAERQAYTEQPSELGLDKIEPISRPEIQPEAIPVPSVEQVELSKTNETATTPVAFHGVPPAESVSQLSGIEDQISNITEASTEL